MQFFNRLMVLVTLFPVGLVLANDGFELSLTSQTGVSVEFTVQAWQIDTVTVDGKSFLKIAYDAAGYSAEPGLPQLPASITLIGLPETGDVRLNVISSRQREIRSLRILPAPELVREGEFIREVFKQDAPLYQTAGVTPQQPVEIQEIGFFRNQRVAKIRVTPVQFFPAQNKIRFYDQILFELSFSASSHSTTNLLAAPDEALYAETLLNYSQAKSWRQTSATALRKSSGFPAGATVYKIPVKEEGVYQVTGNLLKSKGINLAAINPATFKIYNNGGREIPENLSDSKIDGFIENAIEVVDGGDNKFDETDYLLFYAKTVNDWDYKSNQKTYSHYINNYTKENIYWLVWGDSQSGKRITPQPSRADAPAPLSTAPQRFFREDELTNIYHSGTVWYGDLFSNTSQNREFAFYTPRAVQSAETRLVLRFVSESYGTHNFKMILNNQSVGDFSFSGKRYYVHTVSKSGVLLDGLNKLVLQYSNTNSLAECYLDWFEVFYTTELKAVNNELFFLAPLVNAPVSYQVTGFTGNEISVFEVSDFANVKKIVGGTLAGNAVIFADSTNTTSPKRYVTFTPQGVHTPSELIADERADMRAATNGAEYLIITHPDFYDQAIRLADHRRAFDKLSTAVVKIQDVYDDFSGGLFDPLAIRDFLAYTFKFWKPAPELVLLFGDGNYDFKNIFKTSAQNWIPPYETDDLSETDSRAMDEWFTYVSGNDYIIDLGIGRLPVQTAAEAKIMVDKIIEYDTEPLRGEWKNTISILADDEFDQNGTIIGWNVTHSEDAEELIDGYVPPTFNVNKIYLMEYPAVQSASISGIRKPTAGEDLINQINRGTLVLNFIGHGNETVLTHERILEISDVNSQIQNGAHYLFWVAATCAWGRFDMPQAQAMSEQILLMEKRGAVGMITASRDAFAGPNAQLNKYIFRELFPKFNGKYLHGQTTRVGEALMNAKNYSGNNTNNQKYHLLGDPAMKLALPRYSAVLTSVSPDTFKALSKITVTGSIYEDNSPWTDFNGEIYLTAFDSRKIKTYTFEDPPTTYRVQYKLPGSAIFRGTVPVINGQFETSFIVPKDITYGGTLGRIATYYWNDEIDGSGKRDSLTVGGTAQGIVDQAGPEIKIHFQGANIGEGAIVGPNPTLMVAIADLESGVNITGEIGHKIILTLDDDMENRRDITDFFTFDKGSYLQGTIKYPLANYWGSTSEGFQNTSGLTPGQHTISLKAWDNFNNSNTESITFTVAAEGAFVIKDLLNYPNPLVNETTFSFFISHEAEIKIQIYTVAGRLIRTLESVAEAGFNFNYKWDARDAEGDAIANGVYLYRLSARSVTDSGKQTDAIGRLVIMR